MRFRKVILPLALPFVWFLLFIGRIVFSGGIMGFPDVLALLFGILGWGCAGRRDASSNRSLYILARVLNGALSIYGLAWIGFVVVMLMLLDNGHAFH